MANSKWQMGEERSLPFPFQKYFQACQNLFEKGINFCKKSMPGF